MAEELKVVVSADTSQLTAGVNKAAQSLATLRQSSAQAGTAVGNMSRVVQDAPFGFMAISNNLQPLFDDFTRLRGETGSVGGALKALGSSLLGPAGIGFAFAAVTSIITYFTMNTRKAKDELSEVQKETKRFADGMNSAKASAMESGIALKEYVRIARDSSLSIDERNEALKRANDIMGDHGEKLTLVNIGTAAVTEQINKMTDSLIAQAVAQQYTARIAQLTIANQDILTRAEKERLAIETKKNAMAKEAAERLELSKKGMSTGGTYSGLMASKNAYEELEKAETTYKNSLEESVQTQIKIKESLIAMREAMKKSVVTTADLGYKTEEKTKKIEKSTKKDIETIDEFYAKYKENIKDLFRIQDVTKESKLPEQLKVAQSALEGIITEFNAKPDNKFVIKIKEDYDILKSIDDLQKKIKEAKDKFVIGVKIDHNFKPILSSTYLQATKFLQKQNQGLEKQMQDNADAVNSILTNTFINMSNSFAEGLANLMMGGNIGDFFKGIFNQIGEGLINLGKYFVQAAIQIGIVKKFIIKNQALALAGGIALIAIGSIIKSLSSKKSAFATGTTFAPGGLALVGERGPELIGLPRGSQVIPATQTANMMGAMESVQVYGVLRGQDIYFSNKKYGQTYNRTA